MTMTPTHALLAALLLAAARCVACTASSARTGGQCEPYRHLRWPYARHPA